MQEFKPYWIEEAVYPDDYEGYKMLVESTDAELPAENETTRYGFKQLIEVCKLDILQPDITRCGGLTEAKRIGAMATAHNTTVIPHAWSSGIVIAASLHFIATQSIPICWNIVFGIHRFGKKCLNRILNSEMAMWMSQINGARIGN